jgi:hypothetical protein
VTEFKQYFARTNQTQDVQLKSEPTDRIYEPLSHGVRQQGCVIKNGFKRVAGHRRADDIVAA